MADPGLTGDPWVRSYRLDSGHLVEAGPAVGDEFLQVHLPGREGRIALAPAGLIRA